MHCPLLHLFPPTMADPSKSPGLGYLSSSIASLHTLVQVTLTTPGQFPNKAKYPLTPQALLGLTLIIDRLPSSNLLRALAFSTSTPINAIRKPNGSYCLVQDLRAINEATLSIIPMVPNPYSIFSPTPPNTPHYKLLDLKDTFFTVLLSPNSQDLFAFM